MEWFFRLELWIDLVNTMARDLNEIIADFESFQMSEFDLWNIDARGAERLYNLVEELFEIPNPERAMDAMFRVMERLPDADLGMPGPLVHGIEKFANYEPRLVESVKNLPMPLSVWMVNRILNVLQAGEHREYLLERLREALSHPQINKRTREYVLDFLEHQAQKSSSNF